MVDDGRTVGLAGGTAAAELFAAGVGSPVPVPADVQASSNAATAATPPHVTAVRSKSLRLKEMRFSISAISCLRFLVRSLFGIVVQSGMEINRFQLGRE
jgi:hypothetical protein